MEGRRIILGAIVLFLVILGIVLFLRSRAVNKSLVLAPSPTPTSSSNLESRFNLQLPSSAVKTNLQPINIEGEGLMTRDYKDGRFTLTIVANLPDPEGNEFYEGWMIKGVEGEAGYSTVSLGALMMEKGGYIKDYESNKDYSDHKKIVVTKESKADGKMETKVLEGGFN